MTHKLVKRLGDLVELVAPEPGVQRQGERALEGGIGAGERPLVAVGAEPVARFFAAGMLLNVLAAMQLDDASEPWAERLLAGLGKP